MVIHMDESMACLCRREFVRTIGLGTASFVLAGCSPGGGSSRRRPNIVFILIDDLGWRDAGCLGSIYYETPAIDKLAGQGMLFTNAYAAAPNCAPSRACLLSGQYSPRHGIYTVNSSERGQARFRKLIPTPNTTELESGIMTIAEVLKPAGYISASIGKWHLGDDPELGPVGQGFDINIGGGRAGHPGSHFSPYRIDVIDDGPDGEYLTDRLTAEAISFIEEYREKPFFLYLTHYAVHTPIEAKEELIRKYSEKEGSGGQSNPVYAAMIESVDRGVGRLLDKLDELDLTDNTIVFFFSDNGGYGPVTSMAPLRGSKGMLYEGGIREPLIVRWPGRILPGTRCDVPVTGVDFYPTIIEMARAGEPVDQIMDGVSIVPLLRGEDRLEREAIFWHFPAYLEAYRGMEGRWRTTPAGAVRKGEWKLIEFFEDGRLELYNLRSDVGEKSNLSSALPEKTAELHRLLIDWRDSLDAPVPAESNPLYDPGAINRSPHLNFRPIE